LAESGPKRSLEGLCENFSNRPPC